MSFLEAVDSDQLAVVAVVIALLLSENQRPGELNVLGNLVVAIGSIMLTIAAQKEFQTQQQGQDQANQNMPEQITQLRQQLDQLYEKCASATKE